MNTVLPKRAVSETICRQGDRSLPMRSAVVANTIKGAFQRSSTGSSCSRDFTPRLGVRQVSFSAKTAFTAQFRQLHNHIGRQLATIADLRRRLARLIAKLSIAAALMLLID